MRAVIVGAVMLAFSPAAQARNGEAAVPGGLGVGVHSVNDAVDSARGRIGAGDAVLHFETTRLPRDPQEQTEHPDRSDRFSAGDACFARS